MRIVTSPDDITVLERIKTTFIDIFFPIYVYTLIKPALRVGYLYVDVFAVRCKQRRVLSSLSTVEWIRESDRLPARSAVFSRRRCVFRCQLKIHNFIDITMITGFQTRNATTLRVCNMCIISRSSALLPVVLMRFYYLHNTVHFIHKTELMVYEIHIKDSN